MPWGPAPLTQLNIPEDFTPGEAHISIGPDVPATLGAAFPPSAGVPGFTVSAAILWYFNADEYYFEALCQEDDGFGTVYPSVRVGSYTIADGLFLRDRFIGPSLSSNVWEWGSTLTPTLSPLINIINTQLLLQGPFGAAVPASRLDLAPGSLFTIDSLSAPRAYIDGNATNDGTVATSAAGAEAAVPSASWDSEPTFLFPDGALFRVDVRGAAINAAATAQVALIRVRKGAASVAGTVLALEEIAGPAGFAGNTIGFNFHGYVKNTSGADVTTALSLTIQRVAGAANYSLYGDATLPLTVSVRCIGEAADHPGIAFDAPSV